MRKRRFLHRYLILAFLGLVLVTSLLGYRSRTLIRLLFQKPGNDGIYPGDIPPPGADYINVDGTNGTQLIPKIIHQTYKTTEIPDHWQAAQQAVREMHPDYEYMFWTDVTAYTFISIHYPSYLSLYTSYTHPIQRADALRYFLLHHYGGIYLDLDISPYRPLTPLLSYPAFACLTSPTGISNDVLGAVPRHPFFHKVVDSLESYNRKWKLGSPYLEVMYSTGPLLLSILWVEWLGSVEGKAETGRIRVLVKDDKEGYGFWRDFRGGSWHSWDAEMIFWAGDHWMLVALLGAIFGVSTLWCLWWISRRLLRGRGKRYPWLERGNSMNIELLRSVEIAE